MSLAGTADFMSNYSDVIIVENQLNKKTQNVTLEQNIILFK